MPTYKSIIVEPRVILWLFSLPATGGRLHGQEQRGEMEGEMDGASKVTEAVASAEEGAVVGAGDVDLGRA